MTVAHDAGRTLSDYPLSAMGRSGFSHSMKGHGGGGGRKGRARGRTGGAAAEGSGAWQAVEGDGAHGDGGALPAYFEARPPCCIHTSPLLCGSPQLHTHPSALKARLACAPTAPPRSCLALCMAAADPLSSAPAPRPCTPQSAPRQPVAPHLRLLPWPRPHA